MEEFFKCMAAGFGLVWLVYMMAQLAKLVS